MSKIRSSNTQFERQFVVELKKNTKRKFKINVARLKGKPDIVFFNQKLCVFLDSDFWHGWQYPRWKKVLKNQFWKDKIENNRRRDRNSTAYLKRKGWKVVRIWGHQINDKDLSVSIKKILSNI